MPDGYYFNDGPLLEVRRVSISAMNRSEIAPLFFYVFSNRMRLDCRDEI